MNLKPLNLALMCALCAQASGYTMADVGNAPLADDAYGHEEQLDLRVGERLTEQAMSGLRGGYQDSKLQVNVGIEKVTVVNGEVVSTVNTTVQGFNAPSTSGVSPDVQAKIDLATAAAQAKAQQADATAQAKIAAAQAKSDQATAAAQAKIVAAQAKADEATGNAQVGGAGTATSSSSFVTSTPATGSSQVDVSSSQRTALISENAASMVTDGATGAPGSVSVEVGSSANPSSISGQKIAPTAQQQTTGVSSNSSSVQGAASGDQPQPSAAESMANTGSGGIPPSGSVATTQGSGQAQIVLTDQNSTVIQNSLDNQTFQTYTIFNIEVLNLGSLRYLPLSDSLQKQLVQSAAAR